MVRVLSIRALKIAETPTVVPVVPTWPVTGRQRELAVLAAALREGIPSVILAGDAGTGKIRLVREGLALAYSQGRPTAFVAASAAAAAVPLGALAHLLPDEIAPADVGVQLPPANLLRYAAAALVDVLGDNPVLGVDDVHLVLINRCQLTKTPGLVVRGNQQASITCETLEYCTQVPKRNSLH